MTELLPCVEVEPQVAGSARPGCVLWLHGLGANGHDFEPIVPHLGAPHLRFVFPHAPNRPVTINGGMVMPAWYDITHVGAGGQNLEHIEQTTREIRALIERERQRFPASRIVLAGFSQGGAIALHVGVRFEEMLAGLMILSSYEMFPERRGEAHEANRRTPTLFCHGAFDPLVPAERGRAAYRALDDGERPVEWHEYAMAHEVCAEEIADIAAWLGRCLPA